MANASTQYGITQRFVTDSANAQLDELLGSIAEYLQLTPTQHQSAEEKYHAVAEWLSADSSPVRGLDPQIYAQGSLRIGTTVKPLKSEEFDLDLVCELSASATAPPMGVYELLWSRMESNLRYQPLLRRRPRCIRIDYASDFHLDIVPAVPDPHGTTLGSLLIPDHEEQSWLPSNPKGYALWLDEQARLPLREKRAMGATIEPLRAVQPANSKPPLKLAVQLLKRQRDVTFASRSEAPPPSIVLTTLAGLLYQKEEDATDSLSAILSRAVDWSRREIIHLWNPANEKECITDRWQSQPGAYQAFVQELEAFALRWHALVQHGAFPDLAKELELLFGERPVRCALRAYAESRTNARQRGDLHASRTTGTLLTAAAPEALKVPDHTFHGGWDAK